MPGRGKYSAAWRKRDHLSAWILQTLSCIVILVFVIQSFVIIVQRWKQYGTRVPASFITAITFSCLTIIFNIIEIVLFIAGRLDPAILLASAVIKTGIWGYMFCGNFIGLRAGRFFIDPVGISTTIVLFATAISQLVIAAIAVHRERKGTLLDRYPERKGNGVAPLVATPVKDEV